MAIDHGLMHCAVSARVEQEFGGPASQAYLNRHTGDIVFIYENEGEAEDWHGLGAAADAFSHRGWVEAFPQDWVEIPRFPYYPPCDRDPGEEVDQFIRSFLREVGLEMCW